MKYDQSVEIYEDPDNAGKYKTDDTHYSVNVYGDNISVSGNGEITIKTLTPEEVSSPSKKELLYAHDDVFSYNYDDVNDCWVRRAQFMIFQSGSIDHSSITHDNSTWRIFELTESLESEGKNITHLILNKWGGPAFRFSEYDFGIKIHLGFTSINDSNKIELGINYQGTGQMDKDSRYWFEDTSGEFLSNAIKQIDTYAKAHTFAETWMTLDEYNTKHGTSYIWAD